MVGSSGVGALAGMSSTNARWRRLCKRAGKKGREEIEKLQARGKGSR